MVPNEASGIVAEKCPQCGASLPPEGERIMCAYCGSSLVRRASAKTGEIGGWGLRLKTYSCVDEYGIGTEAFRMLVPADWRVEGGVQWVLNNPGLPVVVAFRTYNPHGPEAFEAFPSIPCYWTNNPMAAGMFPVGSLYYGNEVRPPAPLLQTLQELVVPRYRGGLPGMLVVQQEPLPNLVGQMRATNPVAPTGVTSAEGGRIRLHYRAGDQDIEEDLFGVVEMNRQAMPMGFMGQIEQIFWAADYLFAFKAAAGTLDRLSDTFMGLVRSFRIHPEWYGRCTQVAQYLIQNQIPQLQHVGQIRQIVNQIGDQFGGMMADAYNQRQSTMDSLSSQFSHAVRGVDAYVNPFDEHKVELPGGYQYAWSNPQGEYIVTDDATFDPNVDGDTQWEKLQQTDRTE